jgi:hypothetical protein
LSRFGILSATLRGGIRGPSGTFRLCLDHRGLHRFDDAVVGLARLEKELEQHGALELLEGIRDLVAGAAGSVPLGDDAARVRHADAEIRCSYLAFPDDIALFHVIYVT